MNKLLMLVALIVAVIGAIMTELAAMPWFLYAALVLGVLIGFLNISRKESIKLLVAFLALSAVSGVFAIVPMLGGYITSFFTHLLAVFGPATALVAFRVLYRIGSK